MYMYKSTESLHCIYPNPHNQFFSILLNTTKSLTTHVRAQQTVKEHSFDLCIQLHLHVYAHRLHVKPNEHLFLMWHHWTVQKQEVFCQVCTENHWREIQFALCQTLCTYISRCMYHACMARCSENYTVFDVQTCTCTCMYICLCNAQLMYTGMFHVCLHLFIQAWMHSNLNLYLSTDNLRV